MSDFFRPLEVLARDPERPTGIICSGSLGMLRPPFRASIGEGEALVLDVVELTDPNRVVLVTNMPSERLPVTGRVSVLALHLGSFYEVVAELPGQRVRGLQLHVYKSHRKSGRLVDVIAGDGFLLRVNCADVPIVDEPVTELIGFFVEGCIFRRIRSLVPTGLDRSFRRIRSGIGAQRRIGESVSGLGG